MNDPLVIAHRGNHEDSPAPENTLESFACAWERGVDGVEVDCRLTRDGEIVILHDPDTGRIGDRKLKVRESTLEALKQVEVVGRDRILVGKGFRIPTLEEFCRALPHRGLVYLEIKTGVELFEPLARVLHRHNLGPDRVRFIGFPKRPLRKLKARFPEFEVYMLYGPSRVRPKGLQRVIMAALREELDGIDIRVTSNFNEAFAVEIREAGLRPHCYLSDPKLYEPTTLSRVLSAGFDSITTDRPVLIQSAIGEMRD